MSRPSFSFCAGRHQLSLGTRTLIMGIVNCTPDSFSGDGQVTPSSSLTQQLRFALRQIRLGADILDVGGESTRPGAPRVSSKEEIKRVIPLISALAKKVSIPISVDTTKLEVAHRALDAGATIINNVHGLSSSKLLLKMVRDYNAALVLMHSRGTPKTMGSKAVYKDVVKDICQELKFGLEKCLEIGIKKDRIMVDPGFGFAKTTSQNLELLNRLSEMHVLNTPILVGTSRKSFIGNIINKDVGGRLMGTAASCAIAIYNGAHMVRVHDVGPIKEVVQITDAIHAS